MVLKQAAIQLFHPVAAQVASTPTKLAWGSRGCLSLDGLGLRRTLGLHTELGTSANPNPHMKMRHRVGLLTA